MKNPVKAVKSAAKNLKPKHAAGRSHADDTPTPEHASHSHHHQNPKSPSHPEAHMQGGPVSHSPPAHGYNQKTMVEPRLPQGVHHSHSTGPKNFERPQNVAPESIRSHQSHRETADSSVLHPRIEYPQPALRARASSLPSKNPTPQHHGNYPGNIGKQQLPRTGTQVYPVSSAYPAHGGPPPHAQQAYRARCPPNRYPPQPVTQANGLPSAYPVSQAPYAQVSPAQMQTMAEPRVSHQAFTRKDDGHHSYHQSNSKDELVRRSSSSNGMGRTSETNPQQGVNQPKGAEQMDDPCQQKRDNPTKNFQRRQSSNRPEDVGKLEYRNSSCGRKPDVSGSPSASTSRIPLALVGNPGSGKSTILNGVAGKTVFAAGISLGSGLTTSVTEYLHNRISLFDTPGLADLEYKKRAGQELDNLFLKKIPLRIAFVVTLERGRVRPEDALTIELVLDAIKCETNDRFGVVINRVTKRVREAIEGFPEQREKIQYSLTGKHYTSHWCYVDMQEDLEDESDGKLMTTDLQQFFERLPMTKGTDVRTVPIDTDGMEEKMAKHLELIEAIQAANAEQLRRMQEELKSQQAKYAGQEALLRRDEAELVHEIRRVEAETAAAREAAERAAIEARSGGRHRGGRHAGTLGRHESGRHGRHDERRGRSNRRSDHGRELDKDVSLISVDDAENDNGIRRSGRGGCEESDVPVVHGICKEEKKHSCGRTDNLRRLGRSAHDDYEIEMGDRFVPGDDGDDGENGDVLYVD